MKPGHINIDESQTCLGVAILIGIHALPEAENYWSSYPCSWSSIRTQVMKCKHLKKLTETIHINNNDIHPMLVNGMNKCKLSLIVYFNHYIIFREMIWSLMSWRKTKYCQEKSHRKTISPPPHLLVLHEM